MYVVVNSGALVPNQLEGRSVIAVVGTASKFMKNVDSFLHF